MYPRLRAWLSGAHAHYWVLGLSLLLGALSIDTGLGADDHIHALILKGSERIEGFRRQPLDLFRFATGHEADNRLLMREGIFPWWADPQVKLSFWRPLTSIGHYLDYWLWGDTPALMHLHSLLWFGLSLCAVWALYRRVISVAWVAALALLLYAVDDARGAPLAWVANRHALVAAALGLWAPVCHLRLRWDGWRPGAWLGPLALGLGLLASESAIGVVAYLGAFALCLDAGPLWARLLRLWPYAAVIVLWRSVYLSLGYGVVGSGLYVDPVHAPLEFLLAIAERGPPLLLSQLALPWSEWWMGYALVAWWLPYAISALALVVIGVAAWSVSTLFRQEARVRFWCVGMLFALVPTCTTFPSDRMLVFVAIGAMAVVAELFGWLCDTSHSVFGGRNWLRKGWLHAIVAVHLVIAPLLFPLRARGIIAVRTALERANNSLPKDAEVAGQVFVLVNTPSDPFASYVPIMRAALGEPMPLAQAWLAAGTSPVHLERIDEYTLRVRPEGGFLQNVAEWMLRARETPMVVGEEVELHAMRVRVVELTLDGRPAEVVVTFDRPLEDISLRWFRWEGLGYVPYTPPAIGTSADLEAVDLIAASLGD